MKNLLYILIICLSVSSCKTYHDKSLDTHNAIKNYDYQKALSLTAGNKFLKKKRNVLLYNLELGRLFHLKGDYKESNKHLNYADYLMDYQNSVGDFALSVAVNSNVKKYRAEDFEKILIHYYKALNYSYLNETEAAVVEARRMILKERELGEKGLKKYNRDGFGHLLVGQIYEKANQYNNAFIAYRNAYNTYVEDHSKLGVKVPNQLKEDLLRTAYLSNMYEDLTYYENIFKTKYKHNNYEFGEVILYWENGKAPHKIEKNYFFTLVGGNGGFFFVDQDNTMEIPFNSSSVNNNNSLINNINNMTGIRVAMPKYSHTPLPYEIGLSEVKINNEEANSVLETVENINQLAEKTLKEKFIKDLTIHLTRLAVHKIAQMAVKSDSTGVGDIAGTILEAASFVTEKADTRNWQTLPSKINYIRMPLTKPDTNIIELILTDRMLIKDTIKIPVINKKGTRIQFKNIFTPERTNILTPEIPQILINKEKINDSLTQKPIKP